MEGKKRYIAIILFLLICLMVFTFATTSDEELEGTGNNIQEITDKDTSEKDDKKEETKSEEKEESKKEENKGNSTNSNSTNKDSESSADDEENLDGTGEVDNSAYDKALEAVEELEKLLTDAQADIARDLVEEVTNSDQYKELVERIEDAEDAIDAEELVAKLEAMVKEAAQKADITDAKDFRDEEVTEAVNEIDGENLEAVKEDLLDRIEELSKILDDNNDPTIDGIKDGEYTNLDEISLTIADENEVTIKVTKDGNEIDFAEKFTEEGTYEVTVVDAAFNDVTKTFTIDRTQPKFEGLTSGQHYDIIKLDVKDASPVKITISKDHAKEVAIENGTEIKEDGTYRIVATDEAGNKKEIWVAIDSTKPTITPDVEYTNVKGQKVTIADKFLMTVTINGKEYTRSDFAKDKNNENFSMEYTLEEDGKYTIVAKDKKGLTVEKTIILDTVKPKFENLASREVDTDYYKVDVTDVTPVKIYVSKNHKAFEEIQEGHELTEEATYQLKAVDAAGNEYTTWIHIDKTAPTITVTPDKEYMNVCPTIEVFDRYLSKVTIDGKVYDRKDFTKNSSNENFKLNVTLKDCKDGVYTIKAVDKRGLETTKTFVYDKTKPQITGVENGAYYNHDVTPVIVEENLQNVAIKKDGKKYTKYTVGMTLTEEGVYQMRASDKAGNKFDYITFTIDKTAPTARSNWWKKTVEADKNATFTDFPVFTPSEEATVEYVRGEVNMGKPGVYRIRYRITDLAKNSKDYEVEVTVVDTTAPTTRSNWWKKTVEADKNATFTDFPQFTPSDNAEGEIKIELVSGEVNMAKPGVYRLRYRFTDESGNAKDYEVQVTVVDTTAPTTRSNWWKKTVEADKTATFTDFPQFTPSDNAEGEIKIELVSGEVNMAKPGVYRLRYRFTDESGNAKDYEVQVTVVDTTAPTTRSNWWKKTVEADKNATFTDFPQFTPSDNAEGEIKIELVSGEVNMAKPGVYRLRYRFTDESGNAKDYEVQVTVVDTTAPEVEASYTETTVSEDSEEEFTGFPTFKVTDNSKGEVKQELISGSVNIHKVGIYKLVYRFTDESGNYTDKTIIVKVVDTTAPTITGIEDGAYYNTKTTHAIPVASDKNGAILMAKTKLGDVELKALIQNEKELKQVGTYTIYAVDTFGNKSEEYTVHIDPYAPKILVLDRIENISGAYLPIKPVILEHNIDKIEVTLNGKKIDYKAGDQLTKDGKYTMTVTDKANNSTTVEFTMDSVAPTMLVSPTTLGVVDSLDLNDVNNITGLILSEDAEFQLLKAGKNVTVLDKTIPIYEYTKLPEDGIINEEGDYILIAYDKAYNLTAVKFVVDRTAPSINAEDGKFYSSLTLDVKDKNLSTITVKKQGSLIPTVVENGHVIEKDGTYEITAKDIVGVNPLFGKDVQADHTTTITIHIDTKAPTSNVVEGGIYKKVTVSVSDANLDEDSITINGSKYNGDEITKEGNYVLVAKDLAGNTLTVNFEVDKTPITISGVTQNGLYKDDVELEVTARDEEPVIKLNGSEISKKFTINADGEYKVKVTDKWGNEEEVTFTIDKNRPKIKNPFPAIENEIGARKDSSVEVKALVTDNIDADKYINPVVKHDNPAFGDMGELSSIPTTKDYVGRYTLTYNTTDKAGNPADKLVVYVDVIINDYVVSFVDVDDNDFIYTYGDTIPAFEVQIYSGVLEEYVTFDASDIKIEEVDGKTIKEAGTYTVKASANTTKFPNATAAEQVVTIDKKDVEVTLGKNHDKLSSIDRYEFNGVTDPFKVVGIDGVIAGDEVNTEIDYKGCTFGVGEWEATVKLTGKDSKNYNLTNLPHEFTITQAKAKVTLPSSADGAVVVENSEGFDIKKFVEVKNKLGQAKGVAGGVVKGKYSGKEYLKIEDTYKIDFTILDVIAKDSNVYVKKDSSEGTEGLEEITSKISGIKSILESYQSIVPLTIILNDNLTTNLNIEVAKITTTGTSKVYVTNVEKETE